MLPLRRILCGLLLAALLLPLEGASAREFLVFAVKVSLPVQYVAGGKIVKRTLKESDIVNLALGRPLGTKVDKKTEILAEAQPYDNRGGMVVVFDPTQNGLAQVTTVVAELVSGDVEGAFLASKREGHGTGTGTVVATTLGDPTTNGLLASTIFGGGSGTATYFAGKASVKGTIAGRARFRFTEKGQTTLVDGFIVGGKGKVSGVALGIYEDGTFSTCGDGVIQPQFGEECEFNSDSACPNHCDSCVCRVCGNNRLDSGVPGDPDNPGEVCDGTDAAVCQAQVPPVPCKADCTGCQF